MQNDSGWVKAHRKLLNNPVVCKDSDHIAVWLFLLLSATHSEQTAIFGGKKITLLPGQALVTQKEISKTFKIEPSKVRRILDFFKINNQIDKLTDMRKTLVVIENWEVYQNENDKPNDKQMTNQARKKDEKEKRNKKEKEENKESYKNGRSVCSAGAHAHEDTHTDLIVVGKYKNVSVSPTWLSEFRSKYTYADEVIEALSRYKESKGLFNENDIPYLEKFAESDREKYRNISNRKNSAFWSDPSLTDEYWDEFFQAAVKRSEEDMKRWKK